MIDYNKPARVRFAPSPTGHMHLGGARTALYNFLFARRTGGQFILRIEDTDQKRYQPEAEQEILDGLDWLGLKLDEGPGIGGPYGPYRQTERRATYREHAQILVDKGAAFPCFCTPERLARVRQAQQQKKENPHYDGTCRNLDPAEARRRIAADEPHVIRFKTPQQGSTTSVDLLRGPITVENSLIDDYVLLKSDGLPTYHLAAMVDDHLMKITHVIRGLEWQSTFPLHVMIVRAFGWEEPVWVHLSVFRKPEGKGKMSKRDAAEFKGDYSIFIKDLQDLGYIPEGILNWIALMGWGVPEEDTLSLDQMVKRFELDKMTPSPAAINFTKLDHFNGTHIRLLPDEDLAGRLKPFFLKAGLPVDDRKLLKIIPLIRERLVTLDDCLPFAGFFFREAVQPEPGELIAKGLDAKGSAEVARNAYAILSALPDLDHQTAEPPIRAYVEASGLTPNQVFGILRVAVTGQKVSPPLFESMEIIGRQKCLERIRAAISLLEKM